MISVGKITMDTSFEFAPHGYFDTHAPWEHQTDIIAYHNLMEQKPSGPYTACELDIIARAHVLHDQHYNISLNDRLHEYMISQETIKKSVAKQVSTHIEKKITENFNYIDQLANGSTDIMNGFTLNSWWQHSQNTYQELRGLVTRGTITDLYSYYQYMCMHYLSDVIDSGW